MRSFPNRSDSVERSEVDVAGHKPNYAAMRMGNLTSRSSRASSYDPFATGSTRTPMSSPYRSSTYTKPMSHSYTDYSTPSRSITSRHGSTDQIYQHKSPFVSTSTAGYGSGPLYRSSAMNFTRSGSAGVSVPDISTSRSYRDYTPTSSYLNRFRPSITSTTSAYQPRSTFDYRSKTPGTDKESSSRINRFDRETRSMTRSGGKQSSEESVADDVERTFEKLYNRYVKEDNTKIEEDDKAKAERRTFISHSEAEEEASSDEELSPEELDSSFAETLRTIRQRQNDQSVTPRGSTKNSPDATPKCSPMMLRKREEEQKAQSVDVKSAEKENEVKRTSAEQSRVKHQELEVKPGVIPATNQQPRTSLDKSIRRDSPSAKLAEAVEKKKSPPSLVNAVKPNSSPTSSRSVSPNVIPAQLHDANQKLVKLEKTVTVQASQSNEKSPATAAPKAVSRSPASTGGEKEPPTGNTARCPTTKEKASSSSTRNTEQASLSPTSNCTTANEMRQQKDVELSVAVPTPTSTSETSASKETQKSGALPNLLPIVATSYVENASDSSKLDEPTATFTIPLSAVKQRNRSRSASPDRKRHHHRETKENTPQLLTVGSTKVRGKGDSTHMRHSASPSAYRSASDNASSNTEDEAKRVGRKRRDPTRTLEHLKENLATERNNTEAKQNGTKTMSVSTGSTGSEDSGPVFQKGSGTRPPLVVVTQPESPEKESLEEWGESTDADWTEAEDEEDYESDLEYSVSQTFSLKDAMPIGDLYPLSRSSSRCSPFVSDYDSDSSMPLFTLPSRTQQAKHAERAADSRGRVDHLFAVPPPSFTCSITYDGQESWDDESLHSCTEFDDEHYGRLSRYSRPGSSALGAYLSPSSYSSDEDYDGMHYHDEVEVGCTLRLVDKAAMRGSSEEDSDYYDDEEYSDEEYWDEDEEYDEDEQEYEEEEEEEEYDEDEEEEVEEESCEDEMHSFDESAEEESRRSPYPLVIITPAEEEEFVDVEDVENAEFDVEATVELPLPQVVPKPEERTEKHREVTYTKDLPLMNEEERTEQLRIEQELEDKAIKKRVVKDATSERAARTLVPQRVEAEEEYVDLEEAGEEFEVEPLEEHALPQVVELPEEKTHKHREVTYTKDLTLMTEEEKAEHLRVEQEQAEKAIKKRVVKDSASEKAGASRVPQRVVPAEETVAMDESTILPEEEIYELDVQQHEEEKGKHEVHVVPTFVRPLTEKVQEESTTRFADKRVATDFAKKAVIQPPKLQTAAVQKVETKIAPEKPPTPLAIRKTSEQKPQSKANEQEELQRDKKIPEKTNLPQAEATNASKVVPTSTTAAKPVEDVESKAEATKTKEKTPDDFKTKFIEDKSGTRKSALNMTAEDARKKAVADEEAAKQKARRFGTVSSMLNRFKEPEIKEEPITYKRSTYLAAKEPERPKKTYEVIKPKIDDSFDRQMEEIRAKMKSGSSQFESHLKDVSKGITVAAEDIKKRTEEEKKKMIIDSVSGVFSKADEQKARWKERREAETEKELAKIEADKNLKKKKVIEQPKKEPEKAAEPKRTVRKIVKDKPVAAQGTAPAVAVPTFATTPRPPAAASAPSTAKVGVSAGTTPKAATTSAAPKTAAPPSTSTPTSTAKTPSASTAPVAAEPKKFAAGATNKTTTPPIKPASMQKPTIPKNDTVINEDNFDLFQAATNVATRRRKSLVELKAQKEQQQAAAIEKEPAAPASKLGPKGDGAVATKIRNALGNATNVRKAETPSPKPTDGDKKLPDADKKPSRRYATRRKTQEIVNESAEPKLKKRKQLYKRNRFIRDPHDIDVLLGWDKENTFEKMERMFLMAAKDRINGPAPKKRKRAPASKIWISDLTDIDKIYKASEIRDIIASANV